MVSKSRCAAFAAAILALAAWQSASAQDITPPSSPTTTPMAATPAATVTPAPAVPEQAAPAPEAATPTASPAASATPATPEMTKPATGEMSKPAAASSQRLYYCTVPGVGRTVALTFDDGPSAKLTPMLLDILKQRGIHATFFVVGENAAAYPDILKREIAEGHEIGNHSWNHPQLTHLSMDGIRSQIERTNDAIRVATGHNPTLLRPPYGATSPTLNRWFAKTYGMKVILWEVDPLDWKYRNSAHVESEILKQTKPGDIILSHDIHATTVAAMPATLDALIAKGYKFVTVSQLIAMQGTQPAPAPAAKAAKPQAAASAGSAAQ